MEFSNNNVFNVGYTSVLGGEIKKDKKWTTTIKKVITQNKLIIITLIIFFLCLMFNFILIYNFMRILENM